MPDEYIRFDFRELKYQQHPSLIIEACLLADNPTESLLVTIAALDVCGYADTAYKVWMLCPRYGISFEHIEIL